MAATSDAAMSPRQIAEHVDAIAGALARFSAGEPFQLAEVAERFRVLRDQYRAEPKSLDAHVSRLSQLSGQFDALLNARLPDVVDRYHRVADQIRRAESEKQYLRDFLVRKAGPGRMTLAGTAAELTVRPCQSRVLPAAGTEPRARLEQLIQETGQWQQVSQLSRSKLQRALQDSVFGERQQAIAQMCPVTTIHQITSRVRPG